MRLHPTFYVGRLKAYLPADLPSNLPRSSVPARNPTSLDDDVDDDWDQVLPERVQTRSAGVLRTQSSQVDVGAQPVPAAHVESAQQPQSQHPHDLELSQPSREHQVGHSSIPRLQREVGAAHHSTVQAPDCENRRSSPEVFRRDAPPPLVDASEACRETLQGSLVGIYFPADDTWEPSSTLSQDVPDVVEGYESRRKTVIATDAAGFIPDIASRDAHEQRNRDDLPSDSDTETYYEAREHMDDTVDDLGYVNALGDRKDALSLAVARTPGAPKGFSHNGQSMDEYDRACLAHTPSRPIPAGPVAICPRCTLEIPHECGRNKGDTRHKSYDRCAGAGRQ
ncbi:unnamed protein product [Peronospora farinosa]|uniref:Uncharacterized protein n=1 Tax=Peronospora farinosa TaxID=134698 RepID=A0ABN8BYH7_9STRA|nr:unnamed protein product [Peronospora farinosa]